VDTGRCCLTDIAGVYCFGEGRVRSGGAGCGFSSSGNKGRVINTRIGSCDKVDQRILWFGNLLSGNKLR
jgi:hypothetical protein